MNGGLRLEGSVALVTGAASGIGRAISLRYASEGAVLALADLNVEAAEKVRDEIVAGGARAEAYRLDVAQTDQARALVDRVAADFGRLDVLVNSAGVAHAREFFALS